MVVTMTTAGYWDVTPYSHINMLQPNSTSPHPRSRNLQQISLIKNPVNFPKRLKNTSRNTAHNVSLSVPGKSLFCYTSYKWTTEMKYIKLNYYLVKNTKGISYYQRMQNRIINSCIFKYVLIT